MEIYQGVAPCPVKWKQTWLSVERPFLLKSQILSGEGVSVGADVNRGVVCVGVCVCVLWGPPAERTLWKNKQHFTVFLKKAISTF